MRYAVRLAVLLFSVFACLATASAERRVALVIGNAHYKIGPLQNPVNDAMGMASTLKRLRFDKVIFRRNLGIEGFRDALKEMSREAAGAKLAIVYFAGHGTEFGGRNYLIPVDAGLARAVDLDLEAIALDTVLSQLAGVTMLKLVILDACRNNMFPLAGSKRSGSRGLSRVEPATDTLVWYAAKDGTTAEDGIGRPHSPFTDALLKRISTPGLELRFLVGEVRDDVLAATGQMQEPHVYGSLGRQLLYLHPHDASGPVSGDPRLKPPSEFSDASAEAAKARAKMERAKAEAALAAAELARVQAELARAKAEGELARIQAEKQKHVLSPPQVFDTAYLFNTVAVPSFNCRQYATTPLSNPSKNPQTDIFCIEPEAARVDFELGVVFRESVSGLSVGAKKGAIAVQRQWILERNLRCPATWDDLSVPARRSLIADCLISETHIRIRQLRSR